MPQNRPLPPDIKNMNADMFRDIWRKVYYQDDAVNIVFIGPPGQGKSTSADYFGWVLERGPNNEHTFTVEKNIFNKFTDFLRAVKDCKKKGQVFLLEEAGTKDGIYKREWFTVGNKAAAELMQIARRWNLILIFILPERKYLDTDVRDFFNIQVWCKRKDIRKRRTYASIKYLTRDPERGKEYNKFPTVKTKSGITVALTEFAIPGPPQHIIDKWKEFETKFKTEILERSIATLEAQSVKELETEDKRGGAKVELDKLYNELMKNPDKYTKPNREGHQRFIKELIYGNLKLEGRGPGMPTCKILMEMANNSLEREEISPI